VFRLCCAIAILITDDCDGTNHMTAADLLATVIKYLDP
jgi:hypothetical protein